MQLDSDGSALFCRIYGVYGVYTAPMNREALYTLHHLIRLPVLQFSALPTLEGDYVYALSFAWNKSISGKNSL
jgi:hypothetical protein